MSDTQLSQIPTNISVSEIAAPLPARRGRLTFVRLADGNWGYVLRGFRAGGERCLRVQLLNTAIVSVPVRAVAATWKAVGR